LQASSSEPGSSDVQLLALGGVEVEHVLLERRAQVVLAVDAGHARREQHREREVGFAAGSGKRTWMRAAFSFPGLYIGTRMSAERFFWPHARHAGAFVAGHEPLVRVHPLVRDRDQLARMLEHACGCRRARTSRGWNGAPFSYMRFRPS
jgi:hypothetical protein